VWGHDDGARVRGRDTMRCGDREETANAEEKPLVVTFHAHVTVENDGDHLRVCM
jgi:uncharacterized heparinase superfamily protein